MKPRTIIVMLGVLALLAAFSSTARAADDDTAKKEMAACVADRNAGCAGLSGNAMADCKSVGAAFCQAIHKGAFRAAVDYEFLKRPNTISAQAKMKADKSAVIISTSKPSGDYLSTTAAKTTVAPDGSLDERVVTFNITKVPVDKLVIKGAAAAAPVIRTAEMLAVSLGDGHTVLPDGDPCDSEIYWMYEGVQLVDPENLEGIRDLFETFTGILTDPLAYLDLNGDGILDDIDFDILWESLSAVDAEAVITEITDVVSMFDVLVETFLADGMLVVLSTEYDELTGTCSSTEETDPAEELRGAKEELIKSVAKAVVEKEEAPPPPPPIKCLVICDYDGSGACDTQLEMDCNSCNQEMSLNPCDLGLCVNGCFSPTLGCIAPECYIQS